MPTNLVASATVKVNGTALAYATYDELVEIRVEHTMSVPAQATLRFSDPDFELLDGTTFVVGAAIVVSFPDANGTDVPVFDGEVVSIAVDQISDRLDGVEFVVTAYDLSHRLGHSTTVKAYQQQSYADIVTAIARAVGLQTSGIVAESGSSSVQHEYVVQTGTDYALLNDIAYRLGFEWRVEGKKLVFTPREATGPPAATITYGEDLRRIKVRFTAAEQSTDAKVRAWDPKTKLTIVGSAAASTANSVPAIVGGASIGTDGRGKATSAGYPKPRTATTIPVASSAEATAVAKGVAARIASAGVSMRAEALGNPVIALGKMITIAKAGTKLSGDYYVTGVEHIFGRSTPYITRFTTGPLEPTSIVDVLGGQNHVDDFGRVGLCVGIVTNNKDPDQLGRVKVKIPALSDEVESNWARIAAIGAGNTTGLFVLPQVDDEVVVGFEQGDLRRPFVLGGLWGGKAKPPLQTDTVLASNKVVQWSLVSGGHGLAFRAGSDDANKHVKLVLADAKTTLYVGHDKVELISNAKPIEIKNGQASILLAANGDVTIKGNNVKIEASQGVTIDAKTQLAAKGAAGAKLESGAMLELKGSAGAKLEASGITEIKGALVKLN